MNGMTSRENKTKTIHTEYIKFSFKTKSSHNSTISMATITC